MSTFNKIPVSWGKTIKSAALTVVLLMLASPWVWLPASAEKNIGKEQAWEIVKKDILKDQLKGKAIYMNIEPLKPGHEIKSWEKVYKVPERFQQCWMFFVDDQADANWQHPCRYVFVDAGTGKYEIIKSHTPPDSMEGMKKIFPGKNDKPNGGNHGF
ncbi:MAG: hypothetical protein GY940_43140 [bacterium]|nr:hypothetical protein [bacterium]